VLSDSGQLALNPSPTILKDEESGDRSVLVHTPPRIETNKGYYRHEADGFNEHDDYDNDCYENTVDLDKTPRRPAASAASHNAPVATTEEEQLLKTPTESTKWSHSHGGRDGGHDTTPRAGEKTADIIIETTMATPTSEHGDH
jgi:neutral trehalase